MPTTDRGPKPFNQRVVSTQFLRVPTCEWTAIRRGQKQEFRTGGAPASMAKVKLPTPVVAFCDMKRLAKYEAFLMVLEQMWREPLGAITPDSLRAEGYETLAEFRRNWMIERKVRFDATAIVTVCRLRPWQPSDEDRLGCALLGHLYGEWLDA